MKISTILPIYNCKDRLERHLQGVLGWINIVEEVIVVDSGSTDGSLELAREILSPYGAKFIHHPPGLYQSWNAGVAAATQKYIYFSTVEDPITEGGLQHLHDVMTTYDADVVISPPEMRNHDGSESVAVHMPSNSVAKALEGRGVDHLLFNRTEAIALLCGFLPSGVLGSSAGNLYRSELLKKHPFPTNFGHCGDTAWGVSVSPFANIAFTTKSCSKFLVQTTSVKTDPASQRDRYKELSRHAVNTLKSQAHQFSQISPMLGWFDFTQYSTSILWEWIAGLNCYNQELKKDVDALLKQVEYLKEAIITIKQLQEHIQHLESANKNADDEKKQYRGVKGAIRSLRRSFKKL